MKKKVVVFTGGRFEYGILRPVIREIYNSEKLELQLVVSGIHLLRKYGSTINIIKKDKFPIAALLNLTTSEKLLGKVSIEIGNGVLEFTKIFKDLKPDIVLLNGDRSEAFAAAIAAAFLPVGLAHIHGGDISKAGFDESIRHSITKLAHLHFAATEKSRERIIQMGENPSNVFLVGAPGLDDLLNEPQITKKSMEDRLKCRLGDKVVILLQHPVSTSPESSRKEIIETLSALSKVEGTKILIYPNGDPGSDAIIKELEKFTNQKNYSVHKNIDRTTYANLLKISSVFVGNSSGGIIETSSFGLPTVNIGSRQFGRERNKNVVDVAYDRNQITNALNNILLKNIRYKKTNIYGQGDSGKKIVHVLEKTVVNLNLLQKHFYEKQDK